MQMGWLDGWLVNGMDERMDEWMVGCLLVWFVCLLPG